MQRKTIMARLAGVVVTGIPNHVTHRSDCCPDILFPPPAIRKRDIKIRSKVKGERRSVSGGAHLITVAGQAAKAPRMWRRAGPLPRVRGRAGDGEQWPAKSPPETLPARGEGENRQQCQDAPIRWAVFTKENRSKEAKSQTESLDSKRRKPLSKNKKSYNSSTERICTFEDPQ